MFSVAARSTFFLGAILHGLVVYGWNADVR